MPASPPDLERREVLALVGASALPGCSALSPTPADSDTDPAWPMFGYDAGRTSYHPDASVPAAPVEVLWQTRTDGDFLSSPVVVGRTLYVGGRDGRLRAIDVADGTERWNLGFDGAVNVPVAYADGTLFAGTTDGHVHAVDGDGGIAIFGLRFDARQWSIEVDDGVLSPPAASDGTVYAATVGGTLFALDAESGTADWRYAGGGKQFSAPAVGANRVFLNRPARRERLVALAAESGDEEWSFTHGTETAAVFSTPVVHDGQVFLGSPDGNVYALDAATGDVQWTVEFGTPVVSGPAVTEAVTFASDRDGDVRAIDRESGERLWRASLDFPGSVRGPPTVAEESLYVASAAGTIRALDTASGDEQWRFDLGEEVRSGVVAIGGRLYVQTTEGTLYALGNPRKNE